MLERVVRNTDTDVSRNGEGFVVFVTTYYVESSISGGRIRTRNECYDRLSREELTNLLENLAHRPVPGESMSFSEGQLTLV